MEGVALVQADADRAPPSRRDARKVAWATRAGVWLVRLLGWTWRIRVINGEAIRRFRAERRPIVFALWHGQLLPLLYQHRREGVVVLISEHTDGEIIARVARAFGFGTVRGSTSRGAARALLELASVLESGHDVALTPDGPRGPAKSFAPGVMVVAQRAGAPIVGVVATADRAWRLKSWDRFLIPKPFARIAVSYVDPVEVDAGNAREAADRADGVRDAMMQAEQAISA